MKKTSKFIAVVMTASMSLGLLAGLTFVSPKKAEAVNPIVQDVYTADPAPMVCSDGRLYVYTSHDEDATKNGFFTMDNWKCYSTTDMVNWTDHGTILGYEDFSWAKDNSSWACQCVERDGKFYMYVPINAKNGTTAIGVAVADSPTALLRIRLANRL
jgi:beta-xylosidase